MRHLLLPALAAALVFLGSLDHGFVYDDLWKIQSLAAADACPAFGEPVAAATSPRPARPVLPGVLAPRGLTHLSYCLDRTLWGERAFGYHLTNLLLHALAAALAGALALRLAADALAPLAGKIALGDSAAARTAALVTGLLFAVHPVHVDAVASFVNRKDLLAFVFAAAAVLLWRARRRPRLAYAAALLAAGLAAWAKEVAAAGLPLVLLAADLLLLAGNPPDLRPRLRRAALRFAPFAAALLVLAVAAAPRLAAAVAPEAVAATTELRAASWADSTALALAALPRQLALLVLPVDLSADWGVPAVRSLLHPRAVAGLLLLAAWGAAAAVLARRAPLAGLALAWTLLTWLPASNLLVPLTPHYVAERYLYVPSFGVCLLAGWLVARALAARDDRGWDGTVRDAAPGGRSRPQAASRPPGRRRLAVLSLGALVLGAAAWRTVVRVEDWSSAERLWTASLAAGQDTWRVRTNLGLAHAQAGRRSAAVEHYRQALADRPLPLEGRRTLVRNLALAGAPGAAADECRRLLAEVPTDFDCHFLLAETARLRGRRDEALAHYRRALALRPGDAEVRRQVAALTPRGPR